MPGFKYFFARYSGGRDEDRIEVFQAGCQTILVVADGAGGVGGGAQAAETVCARM